jgi:CheY-like chemotaxis protein
MQAATIHAMYPGAAPTTPRVLIADDQPHILETLQLLLKRSGFSTEAATHPARVLRALEADSFDAVLWDLNYTRDTTAGKEGLELVSQIRSIDKLLAVLVMTACVDQAAEASHGVEENLATVTHLTSLERVREGTNGWDCRAIASASAAQPEEI